MSWLFSIVLAGLVVSSGGDPVPNPTEVYTSNNINNTTTIVLGDETERFEQTYPLNANGRVCVSNINGSITVEAWDRNEVKLEAVKIADSKETLAEVELRIDAKPDSFTIETNYENGKNRGREDWGRKRKLEVQFRLSVPRGAILDEIETVNGSVTVSNFTNQTKVSAVNGTVIASNLRGAANLSTVNGTVTADFDRLNTGSKIQLETVNGQVNLLIPSDSNATVRADSVNGNITNEFGLPVRKGKYVGRDLYGKIGGGDVQIKLSSVNGGLTIGRKKDGKNPGPVTDLLPQKGADDDDDWDTSEDKENKVNVNVNIDTAKMNKQIDKSVKAAQKAVQKEQKKIVEDITVDVPEIDVHEIEKAVQSAVNTADVQARIRESMDRQREAFSRMRETNWEGRTPVINKKTNSFIVKGVPKVTIEAKNCSVKVTGWDKAEVSYEVTRITSNRNQTPLSLTDEQNAAGVTIKVENKEAHPGNYYDELERVRVEVFVPKKSDLRITTDGEIRLENVTGEIDLTGGDEAINVRDVAGKLHLASGDARVRVIGFDGDFDSSTADGDVYLEGNFVKLAARGNDGTITLTLPREANASLISNTEIEADGINLLQVKDGAWQLGKGGSKYNFTFVDGRLRVRSRSTIDQN
jgi:hypothetical protein